MEIDYQWNNGVLSAVFPDTAGDRFRVIMLGNTILLECEGDTDTKDLVTGYLDRQCVEALVGLLQRWLETGDLQQKGNDNGG